MFASTEWEFMYAGMMKVLPNLHGHRDSVGFTDILYNTDIFKPQLLVVRILEYDFVGLSLCGGNA